MPSDGHRPPTSWRYNLYDSTVTIVSPEATGPPSPSQVSVDFQLSSEILCNSIIVGPLNTKSFVHRKDASAFCDARSAERAIDDMFLSTPSWWLPPPIWRVPLVRNIAQHIFAVVSNIYRQFSNICQDVALISIVLVVTKKVHVVMMGGSRPNHVELVTNRAFQQSFEAAQLVRVVRPAPRELLESLVTEECVAAATTAEGENEDCMICLEELNGRADVKRLPCSHHFHGDCILRWFKEKDFCPLCRYTYVPPVPVLVPPRK